MRITIKFIVLIFFVGQVHQVFAWGMTGHRVIAEIAEAHLSKKAKRNIQKIIGKQKLAYWSNWADFIKSDPDPALNSTGSWHFVNAPANLSYTDFVEVLQRSSENNLYKAYNRIKEEAKQRNVPLKERQHQLYYILHLVADAHQPMHVGREEDLGGNLIEVTFFGRKGNIHRVWDSDLVDNEKYSFIEYATILNIDRSDYRTYTQSSLEDWLYESHQVANKIYDDVSNNTNLSYTYIYDFKYVMEACLHKAGLRLAKELNEIYG